VSPHSQRLVALPCRCHERYTDSNGCAPSRLARRPASGPVTVDPMLLRLLREPRTGRPAPIARLVALLVVLGLLLGAGPVLLPVARWFVSFL